MKDIFGGYGHPDHVAMHRTTVAGFAPAADIGEASSCVQVIIQQHQRRLRHSLPPAMVVNGLQNYRRHAGDSNWFGPLANTPTSWGLRYREM